MYVDKNILVACIQHDRKAQYELYKLCYGMLMSVCLRYKNNQEDAASVLNQAFLKILNNLDKYKESVPFDAWIKRIMINTVIDEYRRTGKDRSMIEFSDIQESKYYNLHFDYNQADKNFDARELEDMLKELPTVSRQVFNLYAIDGYSHKEIASMLKMSDGTSKWHVSFARKRLREMIYNKLNGVSKKVVNG